MVQGWRYSDEDKDNSHNLMKKGKGFIANLFSIVKKDIIKQLQMHGKQAHGYWITISRVKNEKHYTTRFQKRIKGEGNYVRLSSGLVYFVLITTSNSVALSAICFRKSTEGGNNSRQ